MKKTKAVIFLFFIILGMSSIVHAAAASIKFNGEDEILGENHTVAVEISSDEAIGLVSGVISYDSNIKELTLNSIYNGWKATYNESTGEFNVVKEEGATSGDILQIIYTVNEDSTEGEITISNIEMTTTSYQTLKVEDSIHRRMRKLEPSPTPSPSPTPTPLPSPSPTPSPSQKAPRKYNAYRFYSTSRRFINYHIRYCMCFNTNNNNII